MHFDLAMVSLDNPPGQRKTKAGSLANRFGRVKGFEDAFEVFRGDAAAVVLDLDPHRSAFAAAAQHQSSRCRDRLRGIGQQVHEDLVDLRRNAVDLGQFAVVAFDLGLVLDLVPDDIERAFESVWRLTHCQPVAPMREKSLRS